jgi:hypothetical protein
MQLKQALKHFRFLQSQSGTEINRSESFNLEMDYRIEVMFVYLRQYRRFELMPVEQISWAWHNCLTWKNLLNIAATSNNACLSKFKACFVKEQKSKVA